MARRINLSNINVARSNTIRDINRQIILNFIREAGSISRAEIAKITELQRSTVSLIVEELVKADLIEEIEGESSGGRPPQLLSLKTFKPVALGIDIGKDQTMMGISDLSGRLLEKISFSTSPDLDQAMTQINNNIQYFLQKNGESIEGIGVCVPGLVEAWDGNVINVPHLDWHYPEIVKTIKEATNLPVLVENDTNAIALAELWLGRPEISNVRDFVVVLVNRGIGTGIVIDGQIYRGKGGVAGEFGHMTIGCNAPIACAAGRNDCWEAFASERSAIARFSKLQGLQNGQSNITFDKLLEKALKGDNNAQAALKETAHFIGVGISNLVQGLSPEVTVLVGPFINAWSIIAQDLQNGAEGAICQGYPAVKIIPSSLGNYPVLMGAFSLFLANKFASFLIN